MNPLICFINGSLTDAAKTKIVVVVHFLKMKGYHYKKIMCLLH